MIGCMQPYVCKQPIIALYFEFENELKFYNLVARSPSTLARSRKRHARFLEKKLAGKPDLASSEEDQQDSNNSVCAKELENTSLACGSNSDLVSSENPTPSPAADPDLLNEQAILREFLDTIDSDDSDDDVIQDTRYKKLYFPSVIVQQITLATRAIF